MAELVNTEKKEIVFRNIVNIGLDYDGTVTSDYDAFVQLVNLFRSRGHSVYLVTMRYGSECQRDPLFMNLSRLTNGHLATGRMAKKKFCEDQGLRIDIWIDDNPIAVEKDAKEIWGQASPEGTIVIEQHGTKVTEAE